MGLTLCNPEDKMHGALNRLTLSQESLPYDLNREKWSVNSPWMQEYLAASRVQHADQNYHFVPFQQTGKALQFCLFSKKKEGRKKAKGMFFYEWDSLFFIRIQVHFHVEKKKKKNTFQIYIKSLSIFSLNLFVLSHVLMLQKGDKNLALIWSVSLGLCRCFITKL